ncbi:MAG: hypothetical protein JKY56_15925, partial [Kofleriaceae bacterium]|nr:hypothetical protein [Kofleriaceae bacterium]
MADIFSKLSPWSQSIGSKIGNALRKGSEMRLALSAPQPPLALPSLKDKALARHHLHLALAALHQPGAGKPERFRKLRLLVNTMEQGHSLPAPTPVAVPEAAPIAPITPIRRRDRLVRLARESPLY